LLVALLQQQATFILPTSHFAVSEIQSEHCPVIFPYSLTNSSQTEEVVMVVVVVVVA
jgi:hypothetical protein